MKFKKWLFVILIIIAVGVWFFIGRGVSKPKIRNVLLISIDTCRADYLSCYGCLRQTTPNIDSVAAEGVVFENVYSPVPMTLPAHSSMLTGTIPPHHGIHDNLNYQVGQSNTTLAEILKGSGFATGAVISAFVLNSFFGIDQGFDTYNDKFEEEHVHLNISERKGGETTRFALEWLTKHKDEPFFYFLHYFDPHTLYEPPEPFATSFKDNPYAGEIAYTDHCIGKVVDKLKELGLYDSTLIIITGDHGEMLGEHGESEHQYYIYQSAIKVPLIFRLPGGQKTQRIKDIAGLIDIAPTVCSLLDIELPAYMQGKDLSSYFVKGKKSPNNKERHIYCESFTPTKYNANTLLGVVTDRYKYIQTTRPELYDIVVDPQESNNLTKTQPHRARIMQDKLRQILEEQLRKDDSNGNLELDEEGRKKLESLGYVAGKVSEDFSFDQSKDDPKDLLSFHISASEALEFISQKKFSEARNLYQKLLRQRPDFVAGHLSMGRIAWKQNNLPEAIGHLEHALELDHDRFEAHNNIGLALNRIGKYEEASNHFRESLRVQPGRPEVLNNLGFTLLRQGKVDEAIEQCRKALEIDPEFDMAHCNLGIAFAELERYDEAVKHYEKSLQITPDKITAHNGLAAILFKLGENNKAIMHCKKSLELNPDQAEIHNDLGLTYLRNGKLELAFEHYKKSLNLQSEQPVIHTIIGDIMVKQRRVDDAIAHYNKAVQLKHAMPIVHNHLAGLYFQQKKNEQALTHWRHALDIKPDWIDVLNNIAWTKSVYENESFYNPSEAVELAQKACELTEFKRPDLLDTLSVTYAAMGRFPEAIKTAEKALKLAQASKDNVTKKEIEKHLKRYKANQPYQEQLANPNGKNE